MGDIEMRSRKGQISLRISGIVLAIIVGSTTMVGISNSVGGIANSFGGEAPNSSELQVIQEQRKLADSLGTAKDRVADTGSGIKEGFFGITQIWNGIEALFQSVPVANAMIGATAQIFGLPSWFIAQQNAIVVAVLIFTVILLYRGVSP